MRSRDMNPGHARKISRLAQEAALAYQHQKGLESSLTTIIDALSSKITGCGSDYDVLLYELTQLVLVLSSTVSSDTVTEPVRNVIYLAAGFSQRYARSYPGKGLAQAQAIISSAIRCSKTCEDLMVWVTEDAAKVFIQAGTSGVVAEIAMRVPIPRAWMANDAAMILDRIINALVLKTARTNTESGRHLIIHGEATAAAETAALLESQLKHVVELASRQKYQVVVRTMLSDVLLGLCKLYTAEAFPIRRARIHILVLRLSECYPALVPSDSLEKWQEAFSIDICNLANDDGLKRYAPDIEASLLVARSFYNGRPSAVEIKPSLLFWSQTIHSSKSLDDLEGRIDDPLTVLKQLRSLNAYFGMLGDRATCISLLQIIVRLAKLLREPTNSQCTTVIELACQYLDLGFSEKAGYALNQAQTFDINDHASAVVKLQLQVARAEYLITTDSLDDARVLLEKSRVLRLEIRSDSLKKDERKMFEMVHAQGWLTQSLFMRETGAPHMALAAAKRSVRILNSLWSAAERSGDEKRSRSAKEQTVSSEPDIGGLATGVSKLQLVTKDQQPKKGLRRSNRIGAAFWSLVPLLCKALLHLSDVYSHHGLFCEASYYSQRCVDTMESVGAPLLIITAKVHRSRLMVIANRLEDAELCLAGVEFAKPRDDSSVVVEYLIAKAAIRVREGSLDEAAELYEEAENVINSMELGSSVAALERFGRTTTNKNAEMKQDFVFSKADPPAVRGEKSGQKLPMESLSKRTLKSSREPRAKTKGKASSARVKQRSSTLEIQNDSQPQSREGNYLLSKMRGIVMLEKAMVSLRLGSSVESTMARIEQMHCTLPGTLRQRHVLFQSLMQKAVAALQSDLSLNVMPESTVSFPALLKPGNGQSEHGPVEPPLSSHTQKRVLTTNSTAKLNKQKNAMEKTFGAALMTARECLLDGHATSIQFSTIADTHLECSMLCRVTMLLSATALLLKTETLDPVHEALQIDLPRITALQYEERAAEIDCGHPENVLEWPAEVNVSPRASLTAAMFQEEYIDILPKAWTAVSACLNEDYTELYVARYRAGQPPFILRLPFSRHRTDGDEEAVFDYHKGKAELEAIIQISNYSCHNAGNLEAKGAKSNWWSEREALDRRLHELLINIENIWFGGFKSVFSQRPRRTAELARFRKSLDDILACYLPSRQANKSRAAPFALDDSVLELFVGLGSDHEGTIDLDEPLADLLYFVVDMLQFNGERNAYDEIDFDAMTVDVADALREYHKTCPDSNCLDRHLILILDKRLQAFPWESLPYLEDFHVSRVGSMLSLRDRIVEMRQHQHAESGSTNGENDMHIVARTSGTFILNPSSDLAGTQTTLAPTLAKLTESDKARWVSIVNRKPSEEEFSSALSQSSILLYFGHGGGSQYIRSRKVKNLETCSEVVWLMGCSSGAITEHGDLEPSGIPLAYLLAGKAEVSDSDQRENEQLITSEQGRRSKCMAVVATLWDVTDKDIDRFSLALGEEWGLWPSSEASKLPEKTPKKRERFAAPITPQQIPKTPKTPKTRKAPAPAKTPARAQGPVSLKSEDSEKRSLVAAVARSRGACYLRYLNGAAPVVYGVPVYLGD